jgi:hypothetical protein
VHAGARWIQLELLAVHAALARNAASELGDGRLTLATATREDP